MRLFVTGGTGALGSHTVPALIAAGHSVSALARSAEKAATLADQGAEPVLISLFDADALTAAFDGCDGVVNLASALPSTTAFVRAAAWRECQRIRTEGSGCVVDAALRAGVGLVVQESVAMIYADGADRWLDEASPTERYPISVGNHAAEASAHRFTDSGGRGVVLRFGLFYGPGAAHSEQLLSAARWGIGFAAGRADSYVSSIHLTDAASAVVAALDVPAGVYNVVDDEPVTKREHAFAITHGAGTKPRVRGPGRLALLLGNRTTSLTRSLRVSNRKLRSAGWEPQFPSVREGYVAMAAELAR